MIIPLSAFAPKAMRLLRSSKMTRWATSGHHYIQLRQDYDIQLRQYYARSSTPLRLSASPFRLSMLGVKRVC